MSKRRPVSPWFALPLAGLALASCAWSVPADPGLNAARRSRPPTTAPLPASAAAQRPDDGARTLYLTHCSRCHAPFSPRHVTAAEWPSVLRTYGPRAGLFGADRERVLRWLAAAAP